METITIAGKHGTAGHRDGDWSQALFHFPTAIHVDSQQNAIVADSGNHVIRKITPDGKVSTIAGRPGVKGYADGDSSTALLNYPDGVAIDRNGNVFVTDGDNHLIRKISPDGMVTTLAGKAGEEGTATGPPDEARFYLPSGITCAPDGFIYVVDQYNHCIRKIDGNGIVHDFVGSAGQQGFVDGLGSFARFSFPSGITVDSDGNLYAADRGNHVIRLITREGNVTTIAGTPLIKGSSDGFGIQAKFQYPECVAASPTNEIFVADFGNHSIRKVNRNGLVVTVAGSPGQDGNTDGLTTEARFTSPNGVAVDWQGNVYITEYNNHTVRKLRQLRWEPKLHGKFPKQVRDQIRAMLLMSLLSPMDYTPRHPEAGLFRLPKEILFKIFFCL